MVEVGAVKAMVEGAGVVVVDLVSLEASHFASGSLKEKIKSATTSPRAEFSLLSLSSSNNVSFWSPASLSQLRKSLHL